MSTPNRPIDEPTPEELSDGQRRVSLEHVLDAGAESLLSSIGETDRGSLNYETLDRAVASTTTRIAGRSLDDSTFGAVDEPFEAEGGAGIGTTELSQLVAILETEADVPNFADPHAAKLESASILLHEGHRLALRDPDAFGRRLDAVLRGVPPARVTDLLSTATQDLAGVHPPEDFDPWMRAMMPMLRRAIPFHADRLAQFAGQGPPHLREALWPHVVDEFLLALKTRTREIDPRIHDLEPEAMERALVRLLELSALGGGRLTPGMYQIDQEFARPIALRLMESVAHDRFGPLLLSAFRESMPYDFGVRSCVLAHRRYDHSIGWILTQQLQAPRAALLGDAQRSTAWVLMQGIDALEVERRRELWVHDAVRWIGERDMSGDAIEQRDAARDLFTRIATERRGFRHAWNKACRRAATKALQNPSLP